MNKKSVFETNQYKLEEYILETVYKPHFEPTPLKTLEALEIQAKLEIDQVYQTLIQDIQTGIDLFSEKALPTEKEELESIINKISIESTDPEKPFIFNDHDALFLAKITLREMDITRQGRFITKSFFSESRIRSR